jgi:HEAT repeat protein
MGCAKGCRAGCEGCDGNKVKSNTERENVEIRLRPKLETEVEEQENPNFLKVGKDGKKKFGIADYESYVLALTVCDVNQYGIDPYCLEMDKVHRIGKLEKDAMAAMQEEVIALSKRLLSHEDLAVRLYAGELLSKFTKEDPKKRGAEFAEAVKSLEDPVTVASMLKKVSHVAAKDKKLTELYIDQADHEDETVRMRAAGWLVSEGATGTDGTLEKAMELVEHDPSPEVRRKICFDLGNRRNETALPLLIELVKDSEPGSRLHAACLRGIIEMWSAPVDRDNPSQAAYRTTLEYVNTKPRHGVMPHYYSIAALRWAQRHEFRRETPWFQPEEAMEALVDVLSDRDGNWQARTSAVRALQAYDLPPERLEVILDRYKDVHKKSDRHERDIKQALDEWAEKVLVAKEKE